MADTTPTATALQAHVKHLSIALLRKFQDLLATARDKAPSDEKDDEGNDIDDPGPLPGSVAPVLSPEQVASKQLDIEVSTTALIRAAEDIMVLTRGMKELWVFGGLDTVGENEGAERRRRDLVEEVGRVRGELGEWLGERMKREIKVDGRERDGVHAGMEEEMVEDEEEQEEEEMNVDGKSG
jgi:hypothetical protein